MTKQTTTTAQTYRIADAAIKINRSVARVRRLIRDHELQTTKVQVKIGETKGKGKNAKATPIYRSETRITAEELNRYLAKRDAPKAEKPAKASKPQADRAKQYIVSLTAEQLELIQQAISEEGWDGAFEGVTFKPRFGKSWRVEDGSKVAVPEYATSELEAHIARVEQDAAEHFAKIAERNEARAEIASHSADGRTIDTAAIQAFLKESNNIAIERLAAQSTPVTVEQLREEGWDEETIAELFAPVTA